MDNFGKVKQIDALLKTNYDLTKLEEWLKYQREYMQEDRSRWMARQEKFLTSWDDYITFKRTGRWKESSNLHLPLQMQVVKAFHARCKQAIFSVRPWWMLLPVEEMDQERLKKIDTVMMWACQSYVNYNKGIETAIDDWIWDFATVGWGIMKRRWDVVKRKAIIIEEKEPKEMAQNMDRLDMLAEMAQKEEKGDELSEEEAEVVAEEVAKIITAFDGPVIEPWPHEDFLMPGGFADSTDLNLPHAIGFDYRLTESQLVLNKKTGLFDSGVVDHILEKALRKPGEKEIDRYGKDSLKLAQDRTQGVDTVNAKAGVSQANMTEFMCRFDLDEDGVEEELVVHYNTDTYKIARWTYLDRLTMTGKRPAHKIDLIRRPRRSYALGLVEITHPLSEEMDAIHNMRMDYGNITNIPFFFYRAGSGLKPEKIRLEPGMGYPLDDPQSDINFPRFSNSTAWGFQEENNIVGWSEKLTSITSMNSGIPSQRVGASRTASGMSALLNEANVNLDVMLGRFKLGYAELLQGLLADMQERMPNDLQVRVQGKDGSLQLNSNGQPIILKPTRMDIAGKVDFFLLANSYTSNREQEKQNSIVLSQLLFNPILLQTGIVQPINIYNTMKNVLEKHNVMGINNFITEPQAIMPPLPLYDEIAAITQGLVPRIVWHDNHQAKLEGLKMFSQHPSFMKGIETGLNSKNAMEALNVAVGLHSMMLNAIAAQAQGAQNVAGMQVAPNQATGGAEAQARQQIAQGQAPTGTSEGGMESSGNSGSSSETLTMED